MKRHRARNLLVVDQTLFAVGGEKGLGTRLPRPQAYRARSHEYSSHALLHYLQPTKHPVIHADCSRVCTGLFVSNNAIYIAVSSPYYTYT